MLWKLFLATFRLSKSAVCEMSRGEHDFHDYPDSNDFIKPRAVHFYTYRCARCGKPFQI